MWAMFSSHPEVRIVHYSLICFNRRRQKADDDDVLYIVVAHTVEVAQSY
jgi:hypothetical protein